MRLQSISFILVLSVVGCTSNQSKDNGQESPNESLAVFDTASRKYAASSADQKLIATWESFKQAIPKSDFNKLTSMSFDSVICDDCIPPEEHRVIPADTFYQKYAKQIFSNSFVSLLSDSSKIRCRYDYDSVHFKAHPFLSAVSDLNKPKVAQIFVSFGTPTTGEPEGNSAIMCFIETKDGYKFVEYSTVP